MNCSFFPRLFALGAVAIATAFGSAPEAAELRVVSFNIRLANARDGDNAWPNRKELFFETVASYSADLIGFQEVLAVQYDEIVERVSGYGFAGVARDDGKRKGEWSMVAFRKDRFTALDKGDFWLSETPTVPGSKSWDAALTRICSWVRLRDAATGRELVFANTHFDHKGVVARQEAARVISRELTRIAKDVPAILIGDFNVTENDPAYATLVQPEAPDAIRWIDSYRAVYPQRAPDEASFHGFKGGTVGSRIDFIFHTADFMPLAASIDRSSKDGRYPSDHYPVTALLRWK